MPWSDDHYQPLSPPATAQTAPSPPASSKTSRPANFATGHINIPATFEALASPRVVNRETICRTDFAAVPRLDKSRQPQYLTGEQWASATSRYGLTSTFAIPRDLKVGASARLPAQQATITSAPSSRDTKPSSYSDKALRGKRPPEEDSLRNPTCSSSSKKPRTRRARPRDIDLSSLPKTPATATAAAAAAIWKKDGLTSPLFFSNSPNPMSNRVPVLPPSDTAAALLARLREDNEGVHTVKLPRGHVSSASPARSGSTSGSGSWTSVEPSGGSSRSPNSATLSPALQMLNNVGVIELLEQDERPTFIVDLANPINATKPSLHLIYANASLRASSRVLQLLSAEGEEAVQDASYAAFKAWVMSCVRGNESMDVCLPSQEYGGIVWTCSTLRRRFRFISGSVSAVSSSTTISPGEPTAKENEVLEERSRGPTPSPNESDLAPVIDEQDYFGAAEPSARDVVHVPAVEDAVMIDDGERHHTDEFTNHVFQAGLVRPSFDWTRISLTPELSSHILFARTVDWASTPLGPVEDWTADLRAMANMIMGSPHPAAMYWGPEYITLYNEAYIELAGQKHPTLMGQRYQDAWSEIWDDIAPTMNSAWESGQSTMKNDNQLFINRHGFLEETFFSWSLVPLVGSEGQVVGVYNPAFENTRRKVNERRMLTLREVGERTAAARDVRSFWPRVQEGLGFNDVDIPFALIYSVKDDNGSEISSMQSGSATQPPQVHLEGGIGVPEDHHAAVRTLDLRTSDAGFAPFMRQSMQGVPVVLSADDGTLPDALIEGLDWKGFGDPSRTLVVLPVYPTTAGESVVGFIIMGTNPRRPWDDDYKLFVHLLSRQLATSLASVVLFEEEIRRGQRAAKLAALDREELRTELILRTQEAVESEYKFTRMAEFVPVGMFITNGEGMINFANDTWWEISRHPRGEDTMNTWMQSVRDEDRPDVERVWQKLLQDKEAITHEFRFKCSRQSGDHTIDTWVLMSAFPERDDETGQLKSIFGCITDISSQKWAEAFQMQRREEAVELKRQQENFIDITSHEMRNPLSAIVHCADEISNVISEHYEQLDPSLQGLLDRCSEAANTINLCASHQHRIVDDILTLSKLDSQLLLVTPADAHPVKLVQNVLKMFESEVHTHDIKLDFTLGQEFLDHGIDWVKLDPPRLQQVLINLITNAIKFTRNRDERRISVSLTASRDLSEIRGTSYFPSRREDLQDLASDEYWGDGELINLHFSVRDTGTGLQEDEKKLLFQRFSQASPRTHVKYGGSGLGLFISRMLAELQGGQIGVVSEMGRGSTFSFYIKCRKTEAPATEAAARTKAPIRAGRIATTTTPTPPSPGKAATSSVPPTPEEPKPLGHDVLIVEDNIVNQKVLQRQLKNAGNVTHVANHGGEALDALKGSRFWNGQETDGYHLSVILMDLEMPVMDGMTCAKRIRQLERDGQLVRHIPIIAVTAYARPEQIEDAKAAGIDDVISKPFRIPDLTAKIDELISKFSQLDT